MTDLNDSSQLICLSNKDDLKKEEKRKRSFSGPLPKLFNDNQQDQFKTPIIQIKSKHNDQLNLSNRSTTSNDSNKSTDSNELNAKSNHFLNYILNQQPKQDRNYKLLSPDECDLQRKNAQREFRANSIDNRIRYGSGDASPNYLSNRSNLYPSNRPRSNSEGKSKKSSVFISTIRKSVHHLPWHNKHSNQSSSCPITPNSNEHKPMMSINEENSRIRSDSGSSNGNGQTLNSRFNLVDRFRNRSLSMGYQDLNKKCELGDGADNLLPMNLHSLPRRHSVDPEQKKYRAKSVDFVDFHHSHFSLYRDASTLKNGNFNPYTSTESIFDRLDFENLQKDESLIYLKFFKFYLCYDLTPKSSKLVIFETQLIIKKAFYALVNNGIRAAPLWDTNKQKYVGMLTITDFINVLIKSYNNSEIKVNELEEQKIENWRNMDKHVSNELISIGPDSSVLEAIETLVKNKIHRLPIVDPLTNNLLYIITHKRILKFFFLYCYYLPMPSYMNFSLEEVDVGTFNNIELVKLDTKVIDAIKKLIDKRISALPVVDNDGKLVDIYSKFDILNLAAEKLYNNLDMTIKEALNYREHWFEGVVKCTIKERFICVLERIVQKEVHRIVVVDEEDYVIGMVSLSDILQFLTLKPNELFNRKLIPREMPIEDLDEIDFNYTYNNNDYSSIKNSFKDKDLDLCYTELQKIDEV